MRRVFVVALLALSPVCAPVSARAAPASAQATYDAAQSAFDKGDWKDAIAGFTAVLPADKAAPISPSQGQIASRLAYALLQSNRLSEARAYAGRAVAALPPTATDDLTDAWQTAGDAARFSFDYPDAAQAYAKATLYADKAGDKNAQVSARLGVALALMTVDPKAAGAAIDGLMQDKALVAAVPKTRLAQIVDLRARAAMNAGDLNLAAKSAERAIDLSGGLTTTNVTGLQVAVRNDAGLIYGLRHDDEQTRRYLAFTGAGHQKDLNWVHAFTGDLPVCGENAAVSPQDVAVVQFTINTNGEVEGALPLYVSRTGELGAVFARAVSTWRWDPEALRKIDPFWRSTLVLQLRCQTRPTPEALGLPVFRELAAWLQARKVDVTAESVTLPVAADDARLASTGPEAILPLLARLRHRPRDAIAIARVKVVLEANQAPASAYALLYSQQADSAPEGFTGRNRARADVLAEVLPAFKTRYSDDIATPWLELERAFDLEAAGDFRQAADQLATVLATSPSVLPDGAPIRRVALLHAGLAARRLGAPAAAEARIAASGLNAEQCSLFDTHPVASKVGLSSSYFPDEAMRWGFEGYVKEAFDIAGDGHVENVRTVVAYPPFVFDRNSEQGARTFRYLPPRIGDRSVGCSGQTTSIRYVISR